MEGDGKTSPAATTTTTTTASSSSTSNNNNNVDDLTASQSLSLADSYHVDENYTAAVDMYAATLSVVRDSELAIHLRALSHRSSAFYQLGRYEDALEDATAALEILSKGPSGLRVGEGEVCHKRQGLAAFKLQRYTPAKEALQKAAQLASLNNRSEVQYTEWIRQCGEQLSPSSSSATAATTTTTEGKVAVTKPTDFPAASKQPSTTPAAATSSPPSAPATTTANVASNNKRPTMPKYQYYQSDKFMTISILESNVQEPDLNVTFEPKRLTVILRKSGIDFTVIAGFLYAKIDVEKSKIQIRAEKVLIKLRKIDAFEWHELFGKAEEKGPDSKPKPVTVATGEGPTPIDVPTVKDAKSRPYASHKDWDAIEKNIEDQEKSEKPQGDEAMNKLFQQIYKNADPETQRAMIKSYQTSGGTVLSTNWDEVSKKDYEKERTAPKGMEWKTWEGDKLPMEKDD